MDSKRLDVSDYSEARMLAMKEKENDKHSKEMQEDKMTAKKIVNGTKVKEPKVVKAKKGDKILKMFNDKKTLTQTIEALKEEMSDVYIRKTWKKLEG